MPSLYDKLARMPIYGNAAEAASMFPRSDPERDAEDEASRASRIRRLNAQAEALRQAADMTCPAEVKEFGERHRIPRFAELTWQAGFEAGYAAGLARLRDRQRDEAE